LECGDGVREVTALAVAALKIAKRALTQSGDSEDPSPQSNTLARQLAPHLVHGPNARPLSEVEALHNAREEFLRFQRVDRSTTISLAKAAPFCD